MPEAQKPSTSVEQLPAVPVFREEVAEYVAKRTGKGEDELCERMQTIPETVLNSWLHGQSGP